MDVSALRQQYRMSRNKQRTELHLLRTGSSVVSIVPVAQGWTSSWQPAYPSPPDPKMLDPWRVHLDLHRRRPAIAMESERSLCRSRTASSWFWSRPDLPLIWTSALHPQIFPFPSSQAPPTDTPTAGSGSARSTGAFTRLCTTQDQNQNQNQNPGGGTGALLTRYPFPSRRTLRISEAARRLGLYPSS